MANQKITDLDQVNLPEDLSAEDVFVVVDASSPASPSGETKGITAQTLASALTKLSAGLIGADFINLRDTPNEYTYDNNGNFIKVKVTTNETGDLVGSLDFVDSPGASEQTFPYVGNFETDDPNTTDIDEGYFFPGALVRRTVNGKFSLAHATDDAKAECIGIIKKIKKDDNGDIVSITIVFGGYVEFVPETQEGLEVITSTSGLYTKTTSLENGVVYFLGNNGRLINTDPSLTDGDGNPAVSKPVLIGAGGMNGIFVNYRGMWQPEDEEGSKFIIERDATCSDLEVGDIIRVKEGSGGEEFVLSSAEDFDTSDVLGIVVSASPEHFVVQTNGMVTLDMPPQEGAWLGSDLHLIPGRQYYLDDIDPNLNGGNNPLRLSLNQWSLLDEEQRVAMRQKEPVESEHGLSPKFGTPFRNSRPTDPATPLILKDDASGMYETFSRPVFYAITTNRLLITNHRTMPNPDLECYDCLKNAETQKSIYWPGFPYGSDISTQRLAAREFLSKVWPFAGVGHRATLYSSESVSASDVEHQTLTMKKDKPGTMEWEVV
tara:strand:- start:3284 stop:4924 length:1641 start_codon:yes stop_codon:yes gene_type:complete